MAIQSLRGLAVILMVAGHVIGSTAARGMEVADDSAWRFAHMALQDIRMPLFTVISGFVYAMRPVSSFEDVPGLFTAKVRRLLLPLLTVGALLLLLEVEVPGTHLKPDVSQFWRIYVFPYEHLWFLQAIFLVFVVVALLDAFGLLSTKARALVAIAISSVMLLFIPVPQSADVFSIGGALHLLPFFLMGYVLNRYRALADWRWALVLVPIFVPLYALRVMTLLSDEHREDRLGMTLGLCVGFVAISLLFLARNLIRNRALAWIGSFAFGIYLLHVFGTSAARLAVGHAGISSHWLVFFVSLSFGVAAPIAFEYLFGRFRVVRTLILGEKTRSKVSPGDASAS